MSAGKLPSSAFSFNYTKAVSNVIPYCFRYMQASITSNVYSQTFVPYMLGLSLRSYRSLTEEHDMMRESSYVKGGTKIAGKLSVRVPWEPSKGVTNCQRCDKQFNFFLRKVRWLLIVHNIISRRLSTAAWCVVQITPVHL